MSQCNVSCLVSSKSQILQLDCLLLASSLRHEAEGHFFWSYDLSMVLSSEGIRSDKKFMVLIRKYLETDLQFKTVTHKEILQLKTNGNM